MQSFTLVAMASWLVACGSIDADSDVDDAEDPPVPTCTGHDEDGDGFPDACDVCPTVFDPDQLDRGELEAEEATDGVGDACDPRPTLAGDYIAFVRMHENEASNPYDAMFGMAKWTGDALELGSVSGAGQADFILPAIASRIEIRAHVVTTATTGIVWFGVWYADNAADNPKVFAEGRQDLGGGAVELALKESNFPNPDRYSASLPGPVAFAPGQPYNMIVDTGLVTGGDDRLTIVDGVGIERSTTLNLIIQPGRHGFLEANLMVVAFDHFIAYAIR